MALVGDSTNANIPGYSQSENEVKDIEAQFASGLVTKGEKYNKVIDIWSRANEMIANSMMDNISTEEVKEEVVELTKEVEAAAKPIVHNPENKEAKIGKTISPNRKRTIMDTVLSKINNANNN